jgi:1,4-alpha-glucan branching enzyme
MPSVEFRYLTGIRSAGFTAARLRGSWDEAGSFAEPWTDRPMVAFTAEDGCPGFRLSVELDAAGVGRPFHWGVVLDGPRGTNVWGIPTESNDPLAIERFRTFGLRAGPGQHEDYHLTFARRLGARKHFTPGRPPEVSFAVWAPHAQRVDVVFARRERPYIFDSGDGIDPARAPLALTRGDDGIWHGLLHEPFASAEGLPYLYRILTEQGDVRYRTDVFSRRQAGHGDVLPEHGGWDGRVETLDGSVSCSLVVADDQVITALEPGAPHVPREDFWQHEFHPGRPVPTRLEDFVIYELHVGGLGFGHEGAGTLKDAIAFVDHLVELGVNCVELMPVNEFSGDASWGYGQTHHLAFESSAGTIDDYRHFVRKCHRHGIAVIQDVCYNHYDFRAERSQWQYDSTAPEHNAFFWYEGVPSDHPSPDGGYLDNGSSGFAPRYHEEVVRQQFIASAALMLDECHVDGFRVDLTQAFHRDNAQHSNGLIIARANQFGQKLLREWTRTLRLLKPTVLLVAEDHTGWDAVTASTDLGGLGFTSRWQASFYHHLIGDAESANGHARVLKSAGFGDRRPLDLFALAASLHDSQYNRVVYHESHDEAGNAGGSERTLRTAVGGAPLLGETRRYAEARARVAFSLSLFSAATPLFFMGEEAGSSQPYTVFEFLDQREDPRELAQGLGANLFAYYQDAIALRKHRPALRAQALDVIHANPDGRVIAFVRRSGVDELLVVASFMNEPYDHGYVIQTDESRLPNGSWREILNSDAARYGGANFGNGGAALAATGGRFEANLPACGVLVFWRGAEDANGSA